MGNLRLEVFINFDNNFVILWRFVASKISASAIIPKGTITFDQKPIDNTNSFDAATGHFKAPVQGSYVFFVNAWVRQNTQSEIVVYVNGDSVKYFGDYNTVGDYRQLNFFLAYELQKDDEVWLKNNYADSIYASIYHPTTFLGYLM